MKVSELEGEKLDYWMYRHACQVLDKEHSKGEFEEGYQKGEFRFSTDKAILPDLLELYTINVQRLAGEWLASTPDSSVYGETPILAVCRLVIIMNFGSEVEV